MSEKAFFKESENKLKWKGTYKNGRFKNEYVFLWICDSRVANLTFQLNVEKHQLFN